MARSVRRWFRADIDESVRWDDLDSVGIVAEASLAGGDDVFLLLLAGDSGVALGYNLAASTGVLNRVQALPGYDHAAAVDVVASSFGRAELWRRQGQVVESK